MKRSRKVICIIITFLLTILVLWFFQALLMPKYQKGIVEGGMMAEYYRDTEVPHEVIFIGDCEVYENISTVELYREYGISSYIRGSAQQLVWQSYYILEDTLRYETPRAVVYNVQALKYDAPQSESYNRMTLEGLRWSRTKWDAINESMTEEENMLDYLFPILYYHDRWSSLKSEDFECIFDRDLISVNGYYMRADISPQEQFPDPPVLKDPNLGTNAMYWLNRITELCRRNGIELILVKSPTEYPFWYDSWDEQITAFAQKNDLTYVNYIGLKDQIGLDMSTDTYDGGLHLNIYGAEKYADAIGALLLENVELTDYRNVPEVASLWDNKAAFYDELYNAQMAELQEYGRLISWGMNAVEE